MRLAALIAIAALLSGCFYWNHFVTYRLCKEHPSGATSCIETGGVVLLPGEG